MLSVKHNFLFVHIPKTAGNSLQNVLRHYSDDRIVRIHSHQDGVERFEVRSDSHDIQKHSTLEEYRRQYGEPLFSGLFKFTCVRNTWDRLLSFYFSPHRGPIAWDRGAFIDFIRDIPPMSHYLRLSDTPAQADPFANVDLLLRFEHLESDFPRLCDAIGIPRQPLPHVNRSTKGRLREFYDDELTAIVRAAYHEEIERFGFEGP